MKIYKLTKQDNTTYGGCKWGEGVTHTAGGQGEFCGPGWIHAYTDPLLAVFLNPIHADFKNPKLWEAEGDVGKTDHGLKVGCKSLTTMHEIPMPEVSLTQKIAFGILCTQAVYKELSWNKWAKDWLSGKDRKASTGQANEAAWSAAWSAGAAAKAMAAAAAAAAAWSAAWSAGAAAAAAWAAPLDLIAIAQEAMKVKPPSTAPEVRCDRCKRVLDPWPLKRADVCSPKDWVYCIRNFLEDRRK